jgi:two-component system phosphate regulon sensor histidine kinase PhoR
VEWNLRRDPRVLRLRAGAFPFPDEGQGVVLTVDDITHQEALETTRQKFISNASHELKTPVTGIRIAAENLLDGQEVLPEGQANLKAILRATDRMTLLLDDISELSRIETGALRLERERLDVAAFTTQVVEDQTPQAQARAIALKVDVHQDLRGATFVADPLRLDQLLGNLLSNAIKFSPEGSQVHLAVRQVGPALLWQVRDQGPGISEADQKRIFERFYRAPATRGVPGTGLGLAIVKHLALLMGGEVGVESEAGKGATFTLRLPLHTV